jgi:hypothetical protein
MTPEAAPPGGAPPPGQWGGAGAPPPPPGQQWGGQPPGQQWGGAPPAYGQTGRPPRNGTGTAALVLGILGLLTAVFLIGGALGFVALILGLVGRGKAKRGEATNGGAALGGVITGALAMLVSIGLVVAGAAFLVNNPEFKNLRQCLDHANTQEERDACSQDFSENFATP